MEEYAGYSATKENEMDFVFAPQDGIAVEPETLYNLNQELNLAWQIVEETGANLFLTGRAGTGKTTFLRKLRETTSKPMVVLAPTGVAAINAQGNTIHSFFQFPFSLYIPGTGFLSNDKRYVAFSKLKKRIISSLSLLVIDEVSMVRPDILDAIDSLLRRFRNSSLPFGGVQLLLIGDLRQLPPVISDEEWSLLSPHYATPYFFSSQALQKAGFQAVELSTVYRQTDAKFINILNRLRDGKADMETLSILNTHYIPDFRPRESEGYIRLTTHRNIANDCNDRQLSQLEGKEYEYEALIKGDFPDSIFPADKTLRLKAGSQVMFIKNDTTQERRYYNGLIGRITELSEDYIRVLPAGRDTPIDVERTEWENTRYIINEETKSIDTETTGTFNQYPLRLAWAITIHKSQGLTFDKAIIDAAHAFAPGQAYVALSRCSNLEGMVLSSPLQSSSIFVDYKVNNFIGRCSDNKPTSDSISLLKGEYTRILLTELFDFATLRVTFNDFSRNVYEYLVPLYSDLDCVMKEMKTTIDNEIHNVGLKFINLNIKHASNPSMLIADKDFVKRISNGCLYFAEQLKKLSSQLNRMPKEIGNALYAKRLNQTYDAFSDELELKIGVTQKLGKESFSVKKYIEAKGKASVDLHRERSVIKKTMMKKKKYVKKQS